MKDFFTNGFFRFLLGFTAIIIAGFALLAFLGSR